MMKKIVIAIGWFFFLLRGVFADSSDIGVTATQFLKIGLGARPAGLGGTYVSIGDDVDALSWNPAGICGIEDKEASFMHLLWFQDITVDYLGYAQKLNKTSRFGGYITYLSHKDIMGYDENAEETKNFSAYDLSTALSYAHSLTPSLCVGLNLKIISTHIENEEATTALMDIGTLYKPEIKGLRIGIVASNLGPKIKFMSKDDPPPSNFKCGVSYNLIPDLITGIDIIIPNDGDSYISAGMEYSYKQRMAVRIGYASGPQKIYEDVGEGISYGISVGKKSFTVDYAYVPYGELGETHRVSLKMAFGARAGESATDKGATSARGATSKESTPIRPIEKPVVIKKIIPISPTEEPIVTEEFIPITPIEEQIETEEIIPITPISAPVVDEKSVGVTIKSQVPEVEFEPLKVREEEVSVVKGRLSLSNVKDTGLSFVDISATPNVFSPAQKEETTFLISAYNNIAIAEWKLSITDASKIIVKEFLGKGAPPSTLTWNGYDSKGNICKDGHYPYILTIIDTSGNKKTTFSRVVGISSLRLPGEKYE